MIVKTLIKTILIDWCLDAFFRGVEKNIFPKPPDTKILDMIREIKMYGKNEIFSDDLRDRLISLSLTEIMELTRYINNEDGNFYDDWDALDDVDVNDDLDWKSQ